MKEGTLLTKDKVDLLAPVFQAGAHTMDIKTNDFLKSHGRIQVLEVYVDETKSKKMRVVDVYKRQ